MTQMNMEKLKLSMKRFFLEYGIVFVLILLGMYYSVATLKLQYPSGQDAAKPVVKTAIKAYGKDNNYVVVTGTGAEQSVYAEEVVKLLKDAGVTSVDAVEGGPPQVRKGLEQLTGSGKSLDVMLISKEMAKFKFLDKTTPNIVQPEPYWFPVFLKRSNLLAIADRIVVFAVIAIGMTMVIITTGIDLSVGSLVALSAVSWTILIRQFAGAEQASAFGMVLCALGAMAICACSGIFSGLMVTKFMIPPFIVTLAMMMVASGFAFIFAQGQSIYQVPDSITWLGRGASVFGIPNTVVLMAILYGGAHFLMTRTIIGRYIYAVGGNKEAARLSGVPVNRILFLVYATSGALSGLGGVVLASQLKSGAPTYGVMYELYVIAAVVVGGTSLAGGEGKILGTLIGAFIIAVIQNGMNLTGVESYTQKVVLGFVILIAVLLDMLKKRGIDIKGLLAILKRFRGNA